MHFGEAVEGNEQKGEIAANKEMAEREASVDNYPNFAVSFV